MLLLRQRRGAAAAGLASTDLVRTHHLLVFVLEYMAVPRVSSDGSVKGLEAVLVAAGVFAPIVRILRPELDEESRDRAVLDADRILEPCLGAVRWNDGEGFASYRVIEK